MAILPSRDDIARRRSQPSRNVVSYDIGSAQTQVGSALASAGDLLTRMADEERAKLDRLKVEDRITQLMQSEIELSQEYEAVKGEGVISKSYHEGSTGKYQARIAELSRDLTDDQRAAFETTAKRRGAQFDAGRYSYAAREAENYYVNQNAARIKTWQDKAAVGYANPEALQEALMGVQVDTAKELARQGYTNPADPVVRTKLAEAAAGAWGAAIERAHIDGDAAAFKTLYATAKAGGSLSAQQLERYGKLVKSSDAYEQGQALAAEGVQLLQQGKPFEEVTATILAKAPNEETRQQALANLSTQKQAMDITDANERGEVISLFISGGANNSALQAAQRAPQFRALSPEKQGALLVDMRNMVEQTSDRAYQAVTRTRADISWKQQQADRTNAKKREGEDFAALGKFLEVQDDPRFPTMSRQEFFALAPEIGAANVTRLIAAQAAVKSGAAKFAIDDKILNAAVPEELYAKDNKAKLNAFKGFVESALMDWKAANPGKTPDPDTQRRIASSANAKWVEVRNFWPDKEYTAFEGPPASWVNQLQAAAKRKGKELSQAQIEQAWRAQSLQGQ